jgi:hypothetical protein
MQITLSGFPVQAGTSYVNCREAEKAAARMFNDPRPRAPARASIPRRLWREKGYRVEDVPDAPSVLADAPPVPAPGHVCTGGGLLCQMPYTGRPVYKSLYEKLPLYLRKGRRIS